MSVASKPVAQSQGIVSILGSDCERSKFSSLRRTLSADMSSRKWFAQNGFSPIKKIASSKEISTLVKEDYDDDKQNIEHFEIWNSIQEDKKNDRSGQFDIWSSIVCQNAQQNNSAPVPYIHPLVKTRSNALSVKSLEICTESLGSETGSDCFSSYPSSEDGDATEDDKMQDEREEKVSPQLPFDNEQIQVVKYNFTVGKKMTPRSFPPPLPSLSHRDGAAMHMQSHRHNGRLVLEAVTLFTKQNFHAQRLDGRLVLTFIGDTKEMVEQEQLVELEEVFGNLEEEEEDEYENGQDDEEEEYEVEEENVIEVNKTMMQKAPNFHRLALMMNKPMEVANRNPSWPQKMNKGVKLEEVKATPLAHSLPPRPPVAIVGGAGTIMATTATHNSFNTYEYFWRAKASGGEFKSVHLHNNGNKLIISKNPIANEEKQLMVMKGGKAVPSLRGCKEARRSLSFWEPYCIATS